MFRIKICGITNPADALAAAEAGADAIGLNFCAASKRRVTLVAAHEIVAATPNHVAKVGVFADTPSADVMEIANLLGLDLIQLHGHETPADLAALHRYRLIKAFACDPAVDLTIGGYLAGLRADSRPCMVLLDTALPGQFGGTGQVGDWSGAIRYQAQTGVLPLILAGGLNAENIGEAIRTVRPAAVDTASGVESAPGVKDRDKMARFVAAARAAFSELNRP